MSVRDGRLGPSKSGSSREAKLIRVRGVVQGVGFRPFVYGLATRLQLAGWVRNTAGGVEIALEGPPGVLARFCEELEAGAPPLARIEGLGVEAAPLNGYQDFEIRESCAEQGAYQPVASDVALCDMCRRELFNPLDRRYRYPFINCTHCGPRYTIIHDMPYDRPATSMGVFRMCPRCQAEYDDPANRRFHAQPNACPECGPHVTLTTALGQPLATREDAIQAARHALAEGRILAIKGLGGFHLACDATNTAAVALLRERKRRPAKPLAVMVPDLAAAGCLALVPPAAAALLTGKERPIVLLTARPEGPLASGVAPNTGTVGVMLPYTPLHELLVERAPGFPIAMVMTSGNRSEEPIAASNEEALADLAGIADLFLLHNRDIYARCDDSVWAVSGDSLQPVRRARGYAPLPIELPFRSPQVLACGPAMKNTFCLAKDAHAFVSPHIGDLENMETLVHYERTLAHYQRLFRVTPTVVAHDLHPEYLSTRLAMERWGADRQVTLVSVQHHHAHVAACLVDNGRLGPAIGVAFDGTGYGSDGTIWGGEFLVADLHGFQRVGQLAEFPLPGGEAAIHRPYRTALGLVLAAGLDPATWPGLGALGEQERAAITRQVEGRLNTPLTSSAGRLFDAVAALLGVCGDASYEGQAAVELEAAASGAPGGIAPYPFAVTRQQGRWRLGWRPMLEALLAELRAGCAPAGPAARFHSGLAQAVVQTVQAIATDTGLRLVALSGGCFQNRRLLEAIVPGLHESGFEVLVHRQVPANDGGLALGQAAIAAMQVSD